MCFRLTKKQRIKIAKEDIICYKIVDKYLKSIFQGFQYKLGETYSISEFPAYTQLNVRDVLLIYEGFHSYINDPCALIGTLRIKCVIPKGSKYHVNKEEDVYVSNSIKIVEVI